MKCYAIFPLTLLVITIVGCATSRKSPREAFLSRVPDRTNYFKCYEVSIESLREENDHIRRLTKILTQTVRDLTTNCPPCQALQDRLSRIDMISDRLQTPENEFLERLQKTYDPKTDSILFFHYWSGDQQEVGYLVTQNGIVKKKFAPGE